MSHESIRRMVLSALFLALCLALPFLTGQIPHLGSALLPMHIPVFLCGFACGWQSAAAVGLIAPLLRGAMFGMPPLFPTGLAMSLELAVYGAVTGLLYRRLPRGWLGLYASLIGAMLAGRVAWGVARLLLSGLGGEVFTWPVFLAGAFLDALPGIVCHLLLIPILVRTLERGGMVLDG